MPSNGITNKLWFIKLMLLGLFVSAVLNTLNDGLDLLVAAEFGIVGYGLYWLWTRPKSQGD